VESSSSNVEELVRRIIDAVPGGVVHVGVDGAIRNANAEALRILGFRYDDVTARFVSDWSPETLHEDGRPCPVEDYPVAKVLATGNPNGPITIGIRRPDGKTSWAVFRAVPVLDPGGQLEGAVVTFLDITERKKSEEELRVSEQKWRVLAENHPDFVVIADAEGKFQSVNRVLPHLEAHQVLASHLWDYVHEAFRADFKAKFQHARESRVAARFEARGEGLGRKTVWYETVIVPLVENDRVDRLLVVARDITERRAMLASLAEKERLASVGMVAASVAHEIMNPLTYILANLDRAVDERVEDSALRTKAVVEAREGAKRMQQIVWDLRSLARAGGDELFYVDPRSVLETALRLAGPEVSRAARVKLDLAEIPGVLASESRLCQVFINLLVNAAQSMETRPSHQREIVVSTRHDEAADLVAIAITDSGIGISPDDLERMFEPFYTTKPSGTGLGLSISRDIISRMGGKIDVETTLGEGTTFTVWLSTTRTA
jgi:two-component system, cell cycle sensor histidine kinase and response regulator CckA